MHTKNINLLAGTGHADKLHLSPKARILVFDSGLGGLTVLSELQKLPLNVQFIYAADSAAFPYGDLSEPELHERVCQVMEHLLEIHRPEVVVVACNTVSTLAMPQLRQSFSIPFVATVPAIKPAVALSKSQCFSVLATPGTVSREYTKELIAKYATGCHVNLVGASHLAVIAEKKLRGEDVDDADILREITPCFIENGDVRTDVVVLACTHYPLILQELKRLAPWPVHWLDPAPAIARHVLDIVSQPKTGESIEKNIAVFTSETDIAKHLGAVLPQWKLSSVLVENVPYQRK